MWRHRISNKKYFLPKIRCVRLFETPDSRHDETQQGTHKDKYPESLHEKPDDSITKQGEYPTRQYRRRISFNTFFR